MIDICGVTKSYKTASSWNTVLDDISVTFPTDKSVGILGLNGAGKTTLLRLISGIEPPDRGEIYRDVTTSWPIGFSGAFVPTSTGRESCRFISRIYARDIKKVEDYVLDFSELGTYFDMPIRTYSSGMRARLAFSISMAVEFDCYLVDEITAVGDRRFRDKYRAEFLSRRERSTVIMASHQADTIKEFCDMTAILFNSQISFYDSVEEGMERFNEKIKTVIRK